MKLTEQQQLQLNNIEKQVNELYEKETNAKLKQDYRVFLTLLNKFAKQGIFFIIRTANQHEKIKKGDFSALSFFIGNMHYSQTSFWDFKKTNDILTDVRNRANTYPLGFTFNHKRENNHFSINISDNEELVELLKKEIISKLDITFEKQKDTNTRIFYNYIRNENIEKIIDYVYPKIEEIIVDKAYVEKWDFQKFVNEVNKRIEFIKKNLNLTNSFHKLAPPFNKIFYDENQAMDFFKFVAEKIQLLGVKNPQDKLFTITKPKNKNQINIIYSQWLVLSFQNIKQPILIASLKKRDELEQYNTKKNHSIFSPKINGETYILYQVPYEKKEEVEKYLKEDFKKIQEEFSNREKTGYDSNEIKELKENIFNQEKLKEIINNGLNQKMTTNTTDNTLLENKKQIILYGPPGTGKTYNTKDIIKDFTNQDYETLEQEGRVKFITFHQSYAYEEFIEGIKPNLDGNSYISYNVDDGTFKQIATKATYDILKINSEEEVKFEDLYDELIEEIKNKNIKFQTKNGQELNVIKISSNNNIHIRHGESLTRHIVSKQRIKKLYDNIHTLGELTTISNISEKITELIGGSNSSAYYSVIYKILEYKKSYKTSEQKLENNDENYSTISKIVKNNLDNQELNLINEDSQKPHFLIIDEINRGNISKIFGELITLLEADKRLGEDNELITELPYSKEQFGVPPNLYIIATMNTADKSIASLDLALRRRFGFKEMLPKPEHEKISQDCEGINLQKLLENLNKRIEYLLDKDHLLGHSYFMNINSIKQLKEVFYNEIIPLLEEYFYGDYEKLKLVLGEPFFETQSLEEIKKLFETIEEIDEPSIKLLSLDEVNFEKAIKNIIDLRQSQKQDKIDTEE